jgi:2-(1,2-epoxy-1,2-dihydrophenyl)acetyl-CoA isomerase
MSEPIIYSVDGGLARITLNRPERLNAFGKELALAWRDVTKDATSRDDVGAILIDASGPAFCAGGDVREMAENVESSNDVTSLAHVINEGITALVTSAVPVVAAAHGTTAGGGLGILLSSDYAIIAANSKIGSLYANVGLTPDLSVTAHLGAAVGERRALQLVLLDRMLTAEEALDWGIAAEIAADADAVRARAEELAQFWLKGATGAYGQAKRLVRSAREQSFAEKLDDEARTIGSAFATPEAQARIRAFAARSTST